jgi:uncharacterized protein (TIGR02453 family)
MAFTGWPSAALDFYEGLEADNSRAYWTDHKGDYQRDVKAPMEALLAELRAEFGEAKLFRPNRDTRFSRDKSPYKTAIAAMVGLHYVQLSAEGLMAGGGMYHMDPGQLACYREAVVADRSGRRLESLVARMRKDGREVHGSDALKTAPKGYDRDHPRIELLRYKGLVVMQRWAPAGWLSTAAAKTRVVELFRAAAPLLEWLEANVGPPSEAAVGSRRA